MTARVNRQGQTLNINFPKVNIQSLTLAVGDVPAHRMGVREPAKKGGDFPFLPRPDDEMPVRAHGAPAEDPQGMQAVGLDHDPLEGLEIRLFAKQREPRYRPIEDVVDVSAGCCSCSSWHA